MPCCRAVKRCASFVRLAVAATLAVITSTAPAGTQSPPPSLAASASVEQTTQGTRAALPVLESFDGLGFGFSVAQGAGGSGPRNPSDNSLAVGPDHIFQVVNSQVAIFSKKGSRYSETGKPVFGPIPTNAFFAEFGEVYQLESDLEARIESGFDRMIASATAQRATGSK